MCALGSIFGRLSHETAAQHRLHLAIVALTIVAGAGIAATLLALAGGWL